MSAEVMEKAGQLAEAIVNSKELADMRAAEITMNNDPDAVAILEEFQEKQREIFEMQMSGRELSDDQKKDVEAMEAKMSGNKNIKSYMEASSRFEQLMQSVNMLITRALSGDDGGCDCSSGCGCGSGSGCGC